MSGLSLVTKGFISPSGAGSSGSSGGSPPVFRDENLPKPVIKIEGVSIKGSKKDFITSETFKVKTIKIIEDHKD